MPRPRETINQELDWMLPVAAIAARSSRGDEIARLADAAGENELAALTRRCQRLLAEERAAGVVDTLLPDVPGIFDQRAGIIAAELTLMARANVADMRGRL